MQLTLSLLCDLKTIGPGVAETIKKLNDKVLQLSQASSNTTAEEHKTIQYILNLLKDSVQTGKDNEKFALNNVLGLLNPRSDKTRIKFGGKLDTNFLRASHIDLEQINITDPSSLEATNALISMLSALLLLMPHEAVTQKRTALEEKIIAFKKEHANTINSASFKTSFELNQQIQTELKYIALETTRSVRLRQYQALKKFAEKKEIDNCSPNETFESIQRISDKITQEKNKIITQFDDLTHIFTQKIDALETRSQSLSSNHAKNTYTPAITHARTLLKALDEAKNAFKKTSDLITFQKTTQRLLKNFPGRAAFAENRSNPWFRTFISKPFEILKAVLNALIGLVYKTPGKNNFFKPSETDTIQKFRDYEKDLENLDQDEIKLGSP